MKRKANKNNMKICLVGSSGGHLTHLYMLKPFWKDKDRFWVTFDKEDARSILEGEKMYPCYYPTNRRSRIAFTLQAPLTYIVPEKEKNVNAHQEIDLEIEKDKKVILITDAIVTFNTVKSAIEKNKLENSVICIYTMFYRESDYQGCAEYVDKTFSINNAFRIELFRKEKCTYNKTKCIASNRRLREGEDSTDESDRTQF